MENPEGKDREEQKKYWNILTENFPKSMSDTKPQIQEAQRTPSMINAGKTTPGHVGFNLEKIKDKEKNPKGAEGVGGEGDTLPTGELR